MAAVRAGDLPATISQVINGAQLLMLTQIKLACSHTPTTIKPKISDKPKGIMCSGLNTRKSARRRKDLLTFVLLTDIGLPSACPATTPHNEWLNSTNHDNGEHIDQQESQNQRLGLASRLPGVVHALRRPEVNSGWVLAENLR